MISRTWPVSFYVVAVVWALLEILLSKIHEAKILKEPGAEEYGREIYTKLLVLYPFTLIAAPAECYLAGGGLSPFFAAIFFLSKLVKIAVIRSLGGYWTVKTFRWNNQKIVNGGVYRFFRHPNYIVMAFEIPSYSLSGGALFTALLVTPIYTFLLVKRARLENLTLYKKIRNE